MSDPAAVFGLFLSCIEGQPVTRYGSRVLIGAHRDLINPRTVHYQPELIVGIPVQEARKYNREYRRAIDNGSVTERTAAQWREQNKSSQEVGAPREKSKADQPSKTAKDPTHGHPEGGRKLR